MLAIDKSMRILLTVTLAALLIDAAARADFTYHELYRPQVHYSPPEFWMNDPNGLIRSGGNYQLFYQFHPGSTVWGPMHWGHATSPDLLHWETLPVALVPDDHGAIFSGSAVIDRKNSAGLGPRGSHPLVAVFTYHDHAVEAANGIAVESQGLAFSLDGGLHFQKLPDAVLPNPGVRDFRDPQVQWFAPTRRWILTLVATDHVEFYSSHNLRKWRLESRFGATRGAHGGVWECPNLFRMTVEGTKEQRDVLMVSTNPGAPAGGGGTQYFIGHFDGHRFAEETTDAPPRWIDEGADYYAAVTWNRDADPVSASPILLGWMSDWRYATRVPTTPWRSAMAIPRDLTLIPSDQGFRLRTLPIKGLSTLARSSRREVGLAADETKIKLARADSPPALDVALTLRTIDDQPMTVRLSNHSGEEISLRIDPARRTVKIDRSASGIVDFDPTFGKTMRGMIPAGDNPLKMRLLIDQSSVEAFFADGSLAMTALAFPRSIFDQLAVSGPPGSRIETLETTELKSVWPDHGGNP
jgi:fructan beta-fructosidase